MDRLRWARGLVVGGLLAWCALVIRMASLFPGTLAEARASQSSLAGIGPFMASLAIALVLGLVVGFAVAAVHLLASPPRRNAALVMAVLTAVVGTAWTPMGWGDRLVAIGLVLVLYGAALWWSLRVPRSPSEGAVEGA